MAIIHQADKRSGITYTYEAVYYCDKDKQQSRSKRKFIGRADPVTNAIILTDGRIKKDKITLQATKMDSTEYARWEQQRE